MQNYHPGDVNLFWEDIKENSLLRIKSYRTNQKSYYYAKAENKN
jgi:sugar lactone lactonase YvrE